jgi:alginate O-acetyltransferase complex protein AlgJ
MERLNNKFQQAFCGAFLIGLASLGILSHESPKSQDKMSILKGSLQNTYENVFSSSNPLRQTSIDIWGAFKYMILEQASNGALIGKDDWLFTTEEMTSEADHTANLEASIQEIVKTHDALQAKDITLIPVIIPDKARVYKENLKQNRNADISNRYSVLLSKLRENKIAVISALDPIQRDKPIADVFMRHDTHWSPFGSKSVAEHIAQFIAPGLLDKVQVATNKIGSEPFDGDLLKYVPTGALRSYIGPDERTIERFETTVQSGANLFGDTTIDVVLVGTSFSAKSDWHFDGFLKQALSVDILNMSQAGKGPFVPMRDYLKSDTFENTPPKLIIWEIPERYTTQDLLR